MVMDGQANSKQYLRLEFNMDKFNAFQWSKIIFQEKKQKPDTDGLAWLFIAFMLGIALNSLWELWG